MYIYIVIKWSLMLITYTPYVKYVNMLSYAHGIYAIRKKKYLDIDSRGGSLSFEAKGWKNSS